MSFYLRQNPNCQSIELWRSIYDASRWSWHASNHRRMKHCAIHIVPIVGSDVVYPAAEKQNVDPVHAHLHR